ncbi:hypothetical protein ADUPG1_006936 [Aduncisulcus paluster]|uniref:Uncharacterized protein n=1 Tax=Aduncisulcus paluster TaxID=2918883 RepID=A0ABQ5KK46_9EUKA|nr:hypothetical protein ADUPG1_006936 [Aduncisulcus paluster]
MSSFSSLYVKPEFIHEGNQSCCPIPRDANNIEAPDFLVLKAINATEEEDDKGYDRSSQAQKIMKGEYCCGCFTHVSIPFSSSSSIKGAYICLYCYDSASPSHLMFTFTSSNGEQTSKIYEFPESEEDSWFFLPIDLFDVVLCEITGKGKEEEDFQINSLVFFREETSEEAIVSDEWNETAVMRPKFVMEGDKESCGRKSIPIPRDDPKLVDPSFSMIKCKNDSVSKESECYDQSSDAQKMLKGKDDLCLSHLSIPFPSPSPMKGAYIFVNVFYSSPSLLFTFTDCDGKKTSKKYEFTQPKYKYEWHFLPIDLDNVVLCEIEGKGMWAEEKSRYFWINSLVFTMPEETIAAEQLSLLPWK